MVVDLRLFTVPLDIEFLVNASKASRRALRAGSAASCAARISAEAQDRLMISDPSAFSGVLVSEKLVLVHPLAIINNRRVPGMIFFIIVFLKMVRKNML